MNRTRLLYRFVVLPLVINFLPCFTLLNCAYPASQSAQSQLVEEDDGEDGYQRALQLISQGKNSEALPLLETAWRMHPTDRNILADYLDTLVWLRQYDKAIKIYTAHKNRLKGIKFLYRNMGKAFYETGDYRQAQPLYVQAFAFDDSDAEALKGVVFSSWQLSDYRTGFRAWLKAYQKQSVTPQTLVALKIYMMQHLGANTLAWLYARQAGVKDKEIMASLEGDVATERIKWEETDVAIHILEELLRDDPNNFRARSDYIVALRDKYRMKEVLDQYQILQKSGRPAPFWVTEAVADALLYLRQPQEAVKFYQKRLEQNPEAPLTAYLGLCSAYTEWRQWPEAERAWEQASDLLKRQKLNDTEAHDALLARGWFLIYEDKLKESQDFFGTLLERTGLDPGFRSGLASAYLYRGWPRRALEQFQISENVDPKFIPTQVGKATALNDIGYKYEARKLAAELYQKYPYDLHVKDLYDTLQVEDMHTVWGDARFINEWPGVTEYRFRGGGIATVTPVFKVFADILHMHATENTSGQKYAFSWDRVGMGINWLVLPSLTLTQSVSSDYLKGRYLGSFTKVTWQASDQLKASAAFDSYSLEIPLRALATGVGGKTAFLDLSYHESDLRDYGLIFMSNWLSDGNFNPSVLMALDQNVINNPNWKLRIGPELYYGRYSKNQNDVPYYSPNFEYSVSLKETLQLIWYEAYDKKVRSNIYTHIGLYREWGYAFYPITGITFEQEIRTSKTFGLKFLVGYNLRVYDGQYTNAFDTFLTINKKF